jgi:hypothetical protein
MQLYLGLIHGFLSLYWQNKNMLAPELFLVLSTPAVYDR